MSRPDFLQKNENEDRAQLSNKNLSNETLSLRLDQLEKYLEAEGSQLQQIQIDLDLSNNPKVTDHDEEFDGFGRLLIFLKNFGTCVKRLKIGGTGISGAGLCQLVEFIKMGAAEELNFSNLLNVEQADVVALFSAVKECQHYPLNKSVPLLLHLDKNGLANPDHLVAMLGHDDLCCEVLMETSEVEKAKVARKAPGKAETDVMISLPYFYYQEQDEAVTTPTPKTPPSPASMTPEKQALNLKAKAPAPPPPPPLMEEVKVEEEDEALAGSVPKAFRGSAKKVARVVVVSAPKRPSQEPPVDLLWPKMSSSAKARHRVECEIKKTTSAKALSRPVERCDSPSPEMEAQHALGEISSIPPPPPRPRPTRSINLTAATPLPPPPPRKKAMPCAPPKLPPTWPPSSDQQDWTRSPPLTAFSGASSPQSSSEDFVIGMPPNLKPARSSRTQLMEVLTQVQQNGADNHPAASKEASRIMEKLSGGDMTLETPMTPTYPTSSQVRTVPSPQQKQAGSHGTKALIEDWPDKESWNGWEEWNGEWYKRAQASEWQKWGEVKKEAPWSRYQKAKEEWPSDEQKAWSKKEDFKEEKDWKEEWKDGKNEWKSWKEGKEWKGDWKEEMKEVKTEEWKGGWTDWKEWKGWNNWEATESSKWEDVQAEEWKTGGWDKDQDEQAWKGDWSQWSSQWSSKAEETTSSAKDVEEEKPKAAVEESSMKEDEEEETEEIEEEEQDQIGHWAKLLQRLQKMEAEVELSEKDKWKELRQTEEEFRDKSTSEDGDISDGDSVFVPNPQSVYMTSAAVEGEDAAMDVEDVIKKTRETIQRARGEAPPRNSGKRGRSPLPQEPPYPPPKKSRHGRRGPPLPSKRRGRRHLDDSRQFVTVGLQELLFSQRSCKDKFQCGRSVKQLVKDLETGKVDHLSAPFLRLTVFETRDEKTRKTELRCIDNRRLLALKEYGKKIGKPNLRVNVSLFSEDTLTQVKRFMQNSDDTDGSDVRLRRSRNDKRKSHSPA